MIGRTIPVTHELLPPADVHAVYRLPAEVAALEVVASADFSLAVYKLLTAIGMKELCPQ